MWPLISSLRISSACCGGLLGRVGELDAAGLHPAAAQHLGLDHDRAADLLGDLARLLGARAEAVLGDGNPRQLDDLPGLELVEPHRGAEPYPTARSSEVSPCSGILPAGASPPAPGRKIDPFGPSFSPLSRCSARACGAVRMRDTVIDEVKARGHRSRRTSKTRFMKRSRPSIALPTRRSNRARPSPATSIFCRRQAGK